MYDAYDRSLHGDRRADAESVLSQVPPPPFLPLARACAWGPGPGAGGRGRWVEGERCRGRWGTTPHPLEHGGVSRRRRHGRLTPTTATNATNTASPAVSPPSTSLPLPVSNPSDRPAAGGAPVTARRRAGAGLHQEVRALRAAREAAAERGGGGEDRRDLHGHARQARARSRARTHTHTHTQMPAMALAARTPRSPAQISRAPAQLFTRARAPPLSPAPERPRARRAATTWRRGRCPSRRARWRR